MMASAHNYLMNMRPDRSYVIPDKAAELFLASQGYARYIDKAKPFMTVTPKGIAYAQKEKAWIKHGRARA